MSLTPTTTPTSAQEWMNYALSIHPHDPMWLTTAQAASAKAMFAPLIAPKWPDHPGTPVYIMARRVLIADRFNAQVPA